MTQKIFLQQGLGTPMGGLSIYGGGGVRAVGIIKKRGWGRLTCFGFTLTPGGPYVLLNNWISGITGYLE